MFSLLSLLMLLLVVVVLCCSCCSDVFERMANYRAPGQVVVVIFIDVVVVVFCVVFCCFLEDGKLRYMSNELLTTFSCVG